MVNSSHREYLKVIVSLVSATLAIYFITYFFSEDLILIEKFILIESYKIIGLETVDAGSNVVIVFRPGKNVITIILTVLCLGIFSMVVFSTFVLSVPGIPLREKLKGLSMGNPILFFATIVRIWVSGLVGVELGYQAFRFVHDIFGTGFMIFMVATLWLDWMYRTSKYGSW